jgi:hypothetical protein
LLTAQGAGIAQQTLDTLQRQVLKLIVDEDK